jgi:ABC-type multidrug transport system fused ATPase/permease subunit
MTRGEMIRSLGIVALMMLTGFIESAIVALVIPIVYIVVDPTGFSSSAIGKNLGQFFDLHAAENLFAYLAGGFIILLILATATSARSRFLSEKFGSRCVNRLSNDVLKRCVMVPYLWISQFNSSTLSHYIIEDVANWRRDFIMPLFSMMQAAIMIISPAMIALALAPLPAVIALLTVAAVAITIVLLFRRKIRNEAVQRRLLRKRMMKTLLQILAGLREIKVSSRSNYFTDLYGRENAEANDAQVSLRAWADAPTNIIMLLGQIGFLLAAIILYMTHASGVEIAAQLALIGVVVTRVVPALSRFVTQVPIVLRSLPFVEGLLDFYDETDKMIRASRRSTSGVPVPANWRKLIIESVWFRYKPDAAWSLKDVNVELERGKFYGFVGRSGSGKTTLVNMLLGLIEPTRGVVRLDDKSFDGISISDWQRHFGYVPQDPFIIDQTLRENVTFGETADDERVHKVLDAARLKAFVSGLESGLDTKVGERGRRLSGGQVQRLAIARALFKEPDILFLDEATSALDSITETEFHDSIDALRGELTALIIAHRVTTLLRCDRIFVLDSGTIVESGTYEELLDRSEIFRRLAAQVDERAVAEA